MSAGLEKTLRSLHESVDDSQPNRELTDVLVEDVKQICLHEVTEKDIIICEGKIKMTTVAYLFSSYSADILQNAKANALVLLSEFIQKAEKRVLPYAVDIKDACVTVYSLDRFAKVKNAAIPVLIKLLELTAGAAMGEDLDIETLIKKFFGELSKGSSKLTASVKASVYNLLGVVAEVFPDLMIAYEKRLVGIYVGALKAEMTAKTKKAELPVIAGCLEGLTSFMLNFTQSIQEGSTYSYDIFKYARMAIDPSISYTRYDVPRAGLRLFARHAGQFKTFLMDEYRPMYEKLVAWSRHNNREVLHLGMAALEAFVKEISEALVEKANEGQKEGAVFKFFLMEFRNIMNNKSSTSKEVSMAIRGYGLLAAPCRSFLSENDVQLMFGEMIHQCEHQFFGPIEDMSEKLMSVPSYLTALANIIKQVDSVPASYALVLERLVITLVENIPQINKPQQFICFKSILQLLLTLRGKSTIFPQMLESIVYQGLLRTCSHPIVAETNGVEESQDAKELEGGAAPLTTYKDYLSLWTTLLESAKIKDLAADDFTVADRTQLTEAIYNQLMIAILKILHKLDLEATIADENDQALETTEEEENLSADPTYGVIAKRPKDFQVFINLVDFCKDLLVTSQWRYFHIWVFTFTHALITLSTRHPLVSGFYKLMSVTMTVANKLDYFQDVAGSCSSPEPMETDEENIESGSKDTRDTYQLIKKFSREVLVRIKQYRDDLLASCLKLILSLPRQIIVDQISDIVPAIQTTFTIGLSYLPLATIGLDALEQWSGQLPLSVLAPYYKDILPCLDTYLRTDSKDSEEAAAEATVMVKSKSSARKAKAPIRLVRAPKGDDKSPGSQLNQVKHRILRYLGGLGGEINQDLLASANGDVSNEAIAWDTQKHLRFDVPFFDMKPVIYFDSFLPQVVKLAQQSSDRQTKVAACELLHSLVLYSLGRGAHMPGQRQQAKPMEQLYRRLFPPLLSLACDVEQVSKDLFEPLMMQLIHWFTNNKMAESPETMALLDCIFDGLVQENDTALRDLSARCLKEFLQWSLKQTSKKAAEKNPVNAKSVFKRMKSYALHPSSAKRFGSAMAFNSVYMIFREEESLVDRFTFEILVYFVESLIIAHKDDQSLGTQKQCTKALEHLERIMKVKAELLKKDPGIKKRPEPSAWNSRKLEIALRWLTRQCGNPQTECRHACMKMVYNLCTLLPGVKTPKTFFGIFLKAEGPQYFLKRFEGGGTTSSESHGLLAYPEMHMQKAVFSLSTAVNWFDMLLAALDCYCWVFQEDLMTPTQIFTGKGSEISKVFRAIVYFLNNLSLKSIDCASKKFHNSEGMVFTPREEEDYNRMKCTVIIRTWNFLSVLLAKYGTEAEKIVPKEMWCENLWILLCDCVVQPTAIGFDMADIEIMQQLPKEMKQVLAVLIKFLPAPQTKQMKEVLSNHLVSTCNLATHLPVELSSSTMSPEWRRLTQMAEGYGQLHAVKLLPITQLAKKSPGIALPDILLDNVFQSIVDTSGGRITRISLAPTALSLVRSFLTLALSLELSAQTLVDKLFNKSPVEEATRSEGKAVSHGGLFFTLMSPVVNSHACSSGGKAVISLLLDRADTDTTAVGAVLVSLLDFVAKDRNLRKREGPHLCQDILRQWCKLACCWKDQATPHSQSLALMLLTKLLIIDSKCVNDPSNPTFKTVFEMYISMLKDSRTTMSFKNQALDLLPFFASLNLYTEEQLKKALNTFIMGNFPLQSSEFAVGTHQYNDYISAIDK
ncbi:DNA-dependent protein kinase catalytic subunit, partial [Plakobranchus ocellatus]